MDVFGVAGSAARCRPTTDDAPGGRVMSRDRERYLTGLRALADLLEKNPDVPLPYDGTLSEITVFCDGKDELVAFARAFPGALDKHVDERSANFGFELHGDLHGIPVRACVHRDEVCTRVVTGTREVAVDVPDPSVAVPMVTVMKTVEDVEWECSPLLAEAVES